MRFTCSLAATFVVAFAALGLRSEAEPPVAVDIAVTDVYDATEAPLRFPQLCSVSCDFFDCGGGCEHRAPEVGPDHGSHTTGAGPHAWCWPGACAMTYSEECQAQHSMCIRGGGSVGTSLAALEAGDFAELNSLMHMGAGIEVLWDAGLLAFYDCTNRVVASVSLTTEELATLAVAEGQLQ